MTILIFFLKYKIIVEVIIGNAAVNKHNTTDILVL